MADRSTRRAQRLLARLIRDRKAATAVEYGLILALIVLGLMTALVSLGSSTKDTWGNMNTKVKNASAQ
ncbi:MAG: Flp family type IVb pilin [Pseudomonadota bacterium]